MRSNSFTIQDSIAKNFRKNKLKMSPEYNTGSNSSVDTGSRLQNQMSGLSDILNDQKLNIPHEETGLGNIDMLMALQQYMEQSEGPYQSGSSSDDPYLSRLAKVESGGDYTAVNKGSGAYGRYQFLPSTLNALAKDMSIPVSEAKTPIGQDKLIREFTRRNRNALIKAGYEPTPLNLYAAHQQGIGGALNMLAGGSKYRKNIASNLPNGMEPTSANWFSYWGKRF